MEEMGFAGGKVLDPCAGVGIFGATAPLNAAIDAVELNETSGRINGLVNAGPGYSATVAPFERVAAATPDEQYDAVVTNVPFGVVADRLNKDPRRYRDYGPWWPALKIVMNRNGYSLGDQSDPLIARAYSFDEDVETLIAADEFRTTYLKTFIIYSNQFVLDSSSGEFWALYDSDMEASLAISPNL